MEQEAQKLPLVMRVVQALVEQVVLSIEQVVLEIHHQSAHLKDNLEETLIIIQLTPITQVAVVEELFVQVGKVDLTLIMLLETEETEQVYQQHSVQMVNLVVHLDIMQVVVQVNIMHQLHQKKQLVVKVVEEMVELVLQEQPTLVAVEEEVELQEMQVALVDQV